MGTGPANPGQARFESTRRASMFELTVTFDNGPEPSVTPEVRDVLARHGIASTFFVIGSKLQNPLARACVERAHAEGHWIGNHTWTHTRPLGEQPSAPPRIRLSHYHSFKLLDDLDGGGL